MHKQEDKEAGHVSGPVRGEPLFWPSNSGFPIRNLAVPPPVVLLIILDGPGPVSGEKPIALSSSINAIWVCP
jgi:hypothetical protein